MSNYLAWKNHWRNDAQDAAIENADSRAGQALLKAEQALSGASSGAAVTTMKGGRAWLEAYASPINNELVTISYHDDPALGQTGAYKFATGSTETVDNYYVITHPLGRWIRVSLN